ncbi:MAG: dipeptide ABC transporter ATP-binding protein [Pseudomonadota bacterium]
MLRVDHLSLTIGDKPILNDVSFAVAPGEILGIVGESGSGKSMTALSIMQLLPEGSRTAGSLTFGDHAILDADDTLMQDLRGDDMAMIFQEPMTALNPIHTIGAQVSEGMRLHQGLGRDAAEAQAVSLLDRVGLPPAHYPLTRFPHEMSGGQRQRVMIAMACAQEPDLLIADEPTTALDVTLQKQILDLLRSLVDEQGMGLILISHDLAVVADVTDSVLVMRNGQVVDEGATIPTLKALRHPYTAALAEASSHAPDRSALIKKQAKRPTEREPLLKCENLTRDYGGSAGLFGGARSFVRAVDHVDLQIDHGESVGLVGESGCGKSTLARMVLALDKPTGGTVRFQGADLFASNGEALKALRRNIQVVFQDPYASFNPRHRVGRIVAEPLYLEPGLSAADKQKRVADALQDVGLDSDASDRYPHEFSGGQRQRIAIARALVTRPALLVADEPVSALDVSIRAQIMDLLVKLQISHSIAMLFISHDLGVVRAMCDRVLVMDGGQIVERGAVDAVFDTPKSEAAKRLVAATPNLKLSLNRTASKSSGQAA